MEIVPLTVAPLAGAVRLTLGSVVSATVLLTVTVQAAEVPTFPAASYALAERLYEPLATVVVLNETPLYTLVVSVPIARPAIKFHFGNTHIVRGACGDGNRPAHGCSTGRRGEADG